MAQCYLYLLIAQIAVLFTTVQCNIYVTGLDVLYQWSTVNYVWSSPKEQQEAIRTERYIPKNVLIWATSVYFYNKQDQMSCGRAKTITFVSTPRTKLEGIPAVLSTVETSDGRDTPRLKPFPNWEYNRQGNCNGFTSIYGLQIDSCQRLWALDTGAVGNQPDGTVQKVCQPKIYIFDDLGSGGRLVARIPIPDDVLACNSFLSTITVDSVEGHGSCENAFAYIDDTYGNGLIVFSLHEKKFSRVVQNSFYPNPNYGDFSIDGVQFQYMAGILGHSLSPIKDGDRIFYYYTASGVRQSYVRTSVIQDQQAFIANQRAYNESFHTYPKRLISQSSSDCMTFDGVMLTNFLSQNAVGCWNSIRDPNFQQTPIVSQNDTTMQYISDMQVYGYRFFSVSSRQQNYFYGTVSPYEINYRILYACVPKLLSGTACESLKEQYESHYRYEHFYEDYDYL